MGVLAITASVLIALVGWAFGYALTNMLLNLEEKRKEKDT